MVQNEGELYAKLPLGAANLSGRVQDNTIIRAKSLEVRLSTEEGKVSGIVQTEYGFHILKVEKIAKEANFRLWFQLYVWKQRELSYQLIERAKNNGFEALIVTTDPRSEYGALVPTCRSPPTAITPVQLAGSPTA